MAQPTDDPKVKILPESELNPLLNPLLSTHMGRWAEVYFTTPSEKRAEAVSDLVRELRNSSSPEEISTPPLKEPRTQDIATRAALKSEQQEQAEAELNPEHEPQTYQREAMLNRRESEPSSRLPLPVLKARVCQTCGHENSALQRFCGMCGSPLRTSTEPSPQQLAEAAQLSAAGWERGESPLSPRLTSSEPVPSEQPFPHHPFEHLENFSQRESFRPEDAFVSNESDPVLRNVSSRKDSGGSDLPIPDSRDDLPFRARQESPAEFSMLSQYQPEAATHNYKLYVGAVVAIILAVLVYMTWRSNSTFWRGSNAPTELPQAVPAPSGESQANPAPGSTGTAAVPANPQDNVKPRSTSPAAASQNPPSQRQGNPVVGAEENRQRLKSHPAAQIVPVTASSATSAGQNGAEELAVAERYLNGGPGASRDSREAALWLWKAVAKQNLTATTLLSDLYLRGDGVTKSCDQARLLLEAAARKGGTAAAERLRNLQAFGCQ